MKNSVIYLTRRCPRNCEYCAIRDNTPSRPELTPDEWRRAFGILEDMGVTFNLILGNEPWLLGPDLLYILEDVTIPTAIYTAAPPPLFKKNAYMYFSSGIVRNMSCGIDLPMSAIDNPNDTLQAKSVDAWSHFRWARTYFPDVETMGTITVHRKNILHVPELVSNLADAGVFVAINLVHWNVDYGFDFFPAKEHMREYVFEEEDYALVASTFDAVLKVSDGFVHDPEYLEAIIEEPRLINMGWHCKGNPYSGPTIDSDGSLRVCGYRKGERTSKFTIFDLPRRSDEWSKAVYEDAMECLGCIWSCPWGFHYWDNRDPELGNKIYTKLHIRKL